MLKLLLFYFFAFSFFQFSIQLYSFSCQFVLPFPFIIFFRLRFHWFLHLHRHLHLRHKALLHLLLPNILRLYHIFQLNNTLHKCIHLLLLDQIILLFCFLFKLGYFILKFLKFLIYLIMFLLDLRYCKLFMFKIIFNQFYWIGFAM